MGRDHVGSGTGLDPVLPGAVKAPRTQAQAVMHYDPLGFLSRPVAALLLVAGAGTIVFNLLTPPRHTTARAID